MQIVMRTVYLVSYDITDAKRLRRTFSKMKEFGERVQLSVFMCKLSDRKKKALETCLFNITDASSDQVLFFPLGLENRFNTTSVTSIGKPFSMSNRKPIIL